jgi:hypothetical protein
MQNRSGFTDDPHVLLGSSRDGMKILVGIALLLMPGSTIPFEQQTTNSDCPGMVTACRPDSVQLLRKSARYGSLLGSVEMRDAFVFPDQPDVIGRSASNSTVPAGFRQPLDHRH